MAETNLSYSLPANGDRIDAPTCDANWNLTRYNTDDKRVSKFAAKYLKMAINIIGNSSEWINFIDEIPTGPTATPESTIRGH